MPLPDPIAREVRLRDEYACACSALADALRSLSPLRIVRAYADVRAAEAALCYAISDTQRWGWSREADAAADWREVRAAIAELAAWGAAGDRAALARLTAALDRVLGPSGED